jgi:FkbM family methyltransferase
LIVVFLWIDYAVFYSSQHCPVRQQVIGRQGEIAMAIQTVQSGARRLLDKVFCRRIGPSKEEIAYRRLRAKGFQPDALIDVGAYEGEWTRMAHRVFGSLPTVMIEPQASKKPWLDRVSAEWEDTQYVSALLSAKPDESVVFYEMETGSSYMPEQSNAPRTETRLVTRTLDDVASSMNGKALFLKIDVQGAELDVLAGGAETLARASLVQLEVALLPYNTGAPTILEVLSFMDARGMVAFDISGETRLQEHLVQIDLLFTPKMSGLRPDYIAFEEYLDRREPA